MPSKQENFVGSLPPVLGTLYVLVVGAAGSGKSTLAQYLYSFLGALPAPSKVQVVDADPLPAGVDWRKPWVAMTHAGRAIEIRTAQLPQGFLGGWQYLLGPSTHPPPEIRVEAALKSPVVSGFRGDELTFLGFRGVDGRWTAKNGLNYVYDSEVYAWRPAEAPPPPRL